MVTKNTIGKMQLAIGVIILIVAIIGFYMAWDTFNNFKYTAQSYVSEINSIADSDEIASNDTKIIMMSSTVRNMQNISLSTLNLIVIIALSSALALFISLLFITQGLANLSGGLQ